MACFAHLPGGLIWQPCAATHSKIRRDIDVQRIVHCRPRRTRHRLGGMFGRPLKVGNRNGLAARWREGALQLFQTGK